MEPETTTTEEETAPAAETALEESDSGTSESSWEGLADSFDEADAGDFEEVQDEEVAAEPAPPAEESENESESVEEEPAPREEQVPAQVEPEVQAEVSELPPPAEQPQEQQPPQPSAEDLQAQRQAYQSQQFAALTERYKLSPEWAEKLDTSPSEVMPQLAANLHMSVFEEMTRTIGEFLPQALEHHLSMRTEQTEKVDKFFSRWGELKEYQPQVEQIAHMWRQMNPTASEAEAIEGIGRAAMGALGLARAEQSQPVQAPPSVADVSRSGPPVSPASSGRNQNAFEALNAAWDTESFDD